MENNRFDRALHLVTLMAVRSDDVHHFAGDAMFVGQRDAAEWMPNLLSEFSLNYLARRVLIKLEWLTYIRQERAGDEIVSLNRNPAAKRTLQHIGNGDALQRARIKMLDESHVD